MTDQDKTPFPTEAETVAALALDTTGRVQTVWPEVDEAGNLAIQQTVYRSHDGAEQISVSTHEGLLPVPHRPRGLTRVTSVSSFIELSERLAISGTVTFNDEEKRSLTSIINYESGWGDHRVHYSALPSPEWKRWADLDGQMMTQREFAEMLQDLRHTITTPDAADIVQIARTFTATRSAKFESGVRTSSGDVQFSYVEETRAQSGPKGGMVEVPEEITLTLPIFRDSEHPSVVDLEFRYDASQSGLRLGYRILRASEVVETAWSALVTQAREGIDHAIFDGPSPDPVSPRP